MGSGCLFRCCQKGQYVIQNGTKTERNSGRKGSGQSTSPQPKSPQGLPVADPPPSTTSSTETQRDIPNPPEPSPVSRHSENGEVIHDDIIEHRRSGVRAERVSYDQDKELVKHAKDKEDELVIKNAISSNEFLRNVLKDDNLQDIIDGMYKRDVEAQEIIITQGEKGMHLFVSGSGTFEVIINNKYEATFNDQRVFGELAILYNAKRLATIKAIKKGQLWVLDRQDYVQIVMKNAIREEEELLSFLKNVPILNSASELNLRKTANLLKKEFFKPDSVIVKQGDRGDKFYIIRAGTVTVTKDNEGVVASLTRGQFFGEKALLKEDFRQATVTADAPGVECLTLDRNEFIEYLGGLDTWVIREGDTITSTITAPPSTPATPDIKQTEYSHIKLKDLERVKTLGVGGFGRVELVKHKKEKLVFALKYLKKIDMVEQQQKEHAFNEKEIQMSCNSIFIVRLYKTFKDSKYLYLLLESCLGGDLWTLLQKQKSRCFEEGAARFLAGCVLEALAFLHKQDYVYRDLKPENLLLDNDGYVKLTDFGFAKRLGLRGKTFTFAGTPEYVAPEIVLNRGHDRAVDYWAFGIFVFELLVGRTPFRTNDASHMRTYNFILSGIDNITFPARVPKSAQNLIKRLCRPKPTDRLGCQRNGPQDIRNHKWFQGFEWEKLQAKKMKAPFVPKLKSITDTQYFDQFEEDKDIPVDETSGWDDAF